MNNTVSKKRSPTYSILELTANISMLATAPQYVLQSSLASTLSACVELSNSG